MEKKLLPCKCGADARIRYRMPFTWVECKKKCGMRTGYYVDGWASTTCILCFVSGIQMISLGVIGEYIGRIYLETKKRPRYFVAERKNITEE